MGTASGVFAGTGFVEFRCDCGAAFSDQVYEACEHVTRWHCDQTRLDDQDYVEGRLATFISPNPIDFISGDLI